METKAETSSGQSRSVGPVAGRSHWAGVWQAVADLPPLGAGASNSESESQSSARVQAARSAITLLSVSSLTITDFQLEGEEDY